MMENQQKMIMLETIMKYQHSTEENIKILKGIPGLSLRQYKYCD